MRIALLYPEPKRGRGNKDDARKETEKVSFSRIKVARQILDFSRPLALAVRDGGKKLDEALAEVKAAIDVDGNARSAATSSANLTLKAPQRRQ